MLWGCGRRASRAKIWGVLTAVAAATAATLSSVSFFALTSDPSASFLTHFHSIFRKPTHHFRFLAGQRPPSLLQASPPLSPSLGSPRSATEDPGAPHPFSSSPSSAPRGPPAAAAAAAAEDPPEPPPAVMAWRSHGSNNKELVENLRRSGVFKDQRVFDVMLQVDRGHFVSQDPYLDMPQSIGFGATISAPHMHAIALEQLKEELVWGHRALDVGSGTGYLTVCMALMVGAGQEGGGVAVGIDYVQGLVDLSRKNVAAAFPSLLSSPNFELIKGDGWAGGPSWGAPYHAIHVGAAAAAVPAALLQQLAAGGKMVIPVQCSRGRITLEGLGERDLGINADLGGGQALVVISKSSGGEISVKYITSVIYVPLVRTSSH